MTRFRLFTTLFVCCLAALAPSLAGAAAVVRGTVVLPDDLRGGRHFLGHWRVENTTVPIQPPPARGDTVVVLVGPKPQVLVPKNTPVEINGLQANPATVVVGEGAVVEFRNSDKVAHELSVPSAPGKPEIMPRERLAAGAVRKQRFGISGEYIARCAEYPHLTVSIIVTSSPFFATVDEKGGFKLLDVPEGPATLRVWSNGHWVYEQAVDVTPKGVDVTIKVPSAANREPIEQ
jgi:plastocyanin